MTDVGSMPVGPTAPGCSMVGVSTHPAGSASPDEPDPDDPEVEGSGETELDVVPLSSVPPFTAWD